MIADWIEHFLVHGEGDYFGQPFRLEGWQRELVGDLYAAAPDVALIGMPKGNGKTELAAAIACYELAGGVTRSPYIPVIAADYDQANLVFGTAKVMISEGALSPFYEVFDTEIRRIGAPGKMERIAAKAGGADGKRPTFAVADELHEFMDNRQTRTHLVIANGLAKRESGWMLNITTAGYDTDSLLGRMYHKGAQLEESPDPRFFFRWFTTTEPDLSDPGKLTAAVKAANPAGDTFLPVDKVIRRFYEIPEYEFRRYHLNQWVATATQWLPTGAWEALDQTPAPTEGDVYLGFDGSYNLDSTALVGCTTDGQVFVLGVWEKPDTDDDWRVPRDEVHAAVADAFERYRVLAMVADPRGWETDLERWAETYGDMVVLVVPQTRPRLTKASARFYAAVVGGEMTHDGNPTLARHLRNATIKETPDGAYITKAGRGSRKKIDAAVAAVLVYDHAMAQGAEGEVSVMLV